MKESRRKVLIPVLKLTEVCEADDVGSVKLEIKSRSVPDAFIYHTRAVPQALDDSPTSFNLFPVVLNKDRSPWELGNLYLLSRIEGEISPEMTTFHSIAEDLGSFKEWLDEHENPDELLTNFPKIKVRRTTYRYLGFLNIQINGAEIAPSTANRRMATVVSFYRWLIKEEFFAPTSDPWEEKSYQLASQTRYGAVVTKKVTSTDMRIPVPEKDDPFDGTIMDGEKLRPLPKHEQQWVLEAAWELGNPEMYLIILFMILTGARIQTATTIRVRHVMQLAPSFSAALSGGGEVLKLSVGPGTLIDTKYGKKMTLHVYRPLYEALRTYAQSSRSLERRLRTPMGDHLDQYLFLSQQGNPYYQAKSETKQFNPKLDVRHYKNGGTVRKYFGDRLIPFIRERHAPDFHMQPHDLRATFGMNQTDVQMALVEKGILTLHQARTNVRDLMGHDSSATTDLYLNYRTQMDIVFAALNSYGEQVQIWIDRAMYGRKDA